MDDAVEFGILCERGSRLDAEIGDEIYAFDDGRTWRGDLPRLRRNVVELAGDPAMIAVTAVVAYELRKGDASRRLVALAAVRVDLMRTCLEIAKDDPVLVRSRFPVAVLVALAAGGLARMPAEDTYEASYRPRFDALYADELAAAMAEVVRADAEDPHRDQWLLTLNGEKILVSLSPWGNRIEIEFADVDGRTTATEDPFWAALPGDGLCRFEYGDIDYFPADLADA